MRIKKIDKLSKHEKDILNLSYNHSYRQIQEITDINYNKVNRDLSWMKIKVLGSKYKR